MGEKRCRIFMILKKSKNPDDEDIKLSYAKRNDRVSQDMAVKFWLQVWAPLT
jgi:hypothetical protein